MTKVKVTIPMRVIEVEIDEAWFREQRELNSEFEHERMQIWDQTSDAVLDSAFGEVLTAIENVLGFSVQGDE